MATASKRMLDMQADRIEMVLAAHKVGARVWGGIVAPRCVTFDVVAQFNTKVHAINHLSEEIALALGVSQCRVYRDAGAIKIEIPQGARVAVGLLELCRRLRNPPAVSAVLGVGRDGRPLLAHLASPECGTRPCLGHDGERQDRSAARHGRQSGHPEPSERLPDRLD